MALVVQTACRIDKNNIGIFGHSGTDSIKYNRCRIRVLPLTHHGNTRPVCPYLQLLNSRSTKSIRCRDDHLFPCPVIVMRQLCNACRLADTVYPYNKNNIGFCRELNIEIYRMCVKSIQQHLFHHLHQHPVQLIFGTIGFGFRFLGDSVNYAERRLNTNVSRNKDILKSLKKFFVNVCPALSNSGYIITNGFPGFCQPFLEPRYFELIKKTHMKNKLSMLHTTIL